MISAHQAQALAADGCCMLGADAVGVSRRRGGRQISCSSFRHGPAQRIRDCLPKGRFGVRCA